MSDSFTSTINLIPKEITRIKNSKIPFAINVVMEKFSEVNSQVTTREILRCSKCKTYLNPFVEIYPPGNLWKCNICMTVNKTELPLLSRQGFNQSNEFSPYQNRVNNFNGTNELELRELKYDVLAPSSFYNKPAPEPVFLFLIEATKSSISNGMLSSVLNCIFNNISLIPNTSGRSKIIISFFNSSVYILKKGLENSFLVVSDFSELPSFFCDDLVFKKEELNLEIDKIVDYFTSLNEQTNDLGGALSVTNKILNGGTFLLFLSSVPNEGLGKIKIEKGNMKCKSNFYKSITGEFTVKQTGINLFLFPQTNVELPTLSILSKFTGGCIFYYPNYESENPMFNSRFVSDFCVFFEQHIGLESVCRIRVPEGVNIKDYFGNLVLRSDGIISFPNFNSGHSFTFELEVTDSFIQNDLTIQIALLKTHENGEKIIKILNIAIPNEVSLAKYSDQIYLSNDFYKTIPFKGNLFFYDFINTDSLVHYLALKAIYNETIQKGNGNTFLTNFLKKISQTYRKILNLNQQNFLLPPVMNDLPLKVLSLMKSIPLRPSSYTPMDFKAYYIYLFYTQYPSFVKKLIFPDLYAIHLLNEDEGLIINDKIVMPEPVRLSLDCLETNGLYLLNTGVNFYFFVGKDCDEDFAYQAVADASGSFLFTKHDNEVSLRLNNIVSHLWADKFISPSYYVVRDTGVPNVLMDIFFGYFVEDSVHGLPDLNGFLMNLND